MQQKRRMSQEGSALIEFSILLGVLVPIGLGIAMIGKVTDLRQTNEQASRYTTWEPTVYSRSSLMARDQALVQQRFFGVDTVAISSENTDADNEDATENVLWGSASRETGELRELASVSLYDNQSITPVYDFDTGKAPLAKGAGTAAAFLGSAFGVLSGTNLGIVADGLLHSEVDLAVNSTSLLRAASGNCPAASGTGNSGDNATDGTKLCMNSAGVILADGWSASGDEQARRRVQALVPSSAAEDIGEALSFIGFAIPFQELESLDTAFGYVDMEPLPEYAKP